jgi:hypothetical protein
MRRKIKYQSNLYYAMLDAGWKSLYYVQNGEYVVMTKYTY